MFDRKDKGHGTDLRISKNIKSYDCVIVKIKSIPNILYDRIYWHECEWTETKKNLEVEMNGKECLRYISFSFFGLLLFNKLANRYRWLWNHHKKDCHFFPSSVEHFKNKISTREYADDIIIWAAVHAELRFFFWFYARATSERQWLHIMYVSHPHSWVSVLSILCSAI